MQEPDLIAFEDVGIETYAEPLDCIKRSTIRDQAFESLSKLAHSSNSRLFSALPIWTPLTPTYGLTESISTSPHAKALEEVRTIQARAVRLPHSPSHCDLHARNMVCSPLGKMHLVDLQDASWAPYVFDYALMTVDPNFDFGPTDSLELVIAEAVDALTANFRHSQLVRDNSKEVHLANLLLGMLYQCLRLIHVCTRLALNEPSFGNEIKRSRARALALLRSHPDILAYPNLRLALSAEVD